MKIGLTYTGSNEKHQNYVRWLQADEDIEIVKLSAEDNNLEEFRRRGYSPEILWESPNGLCRSP
jgi:hypothetical protein